MKTYTKEELQEVLRLHKLWLNDEGGERANLSCADLRCANLIDADLRCANLSCADLRCANLSDADLRDADLRGSNLRGSNLRGADLRGSIYNPFNVITSIDMGELSDELTLELMRQDALICGEEKMIAWANGGNCPFTGSNQRRAFIFQEKRALYVPGKPKMNLMEIFVQYCKEANITI